MVYQKAVYPNNLKIWFFGYAKTPGIEDRKRACITSILARLRSSIRGSFRAAQKPNFQVVWVYVDSQSLASPLRLGVSTYDV